jgi:RimJ/RimL family protein N-acetyltransferase
VPQDYLLVERAVSESLTHLRPWMTWTVHEPLRQDQRIELMRTYRGHFDLGGDYNFGAFSRESGELMGAAVLKMSSEASEREVGFWVHVRKLGQGLATEMTSALLRVAFELEGVDTVELRCDPGNTRSARVAEKLKFAGPVLDPLSYPVPGEGKRDSLVYTLSRVEFANCPAQALAIEAYDVLDQRLI